MCLHISREIEVVGANPYFHRGPIKEARYFYGRAQETARALQMVGNGQSVSVIGPRRIGKSSLLLHLADSTVQAEHGLVPDQSCFVYVDAGALSGLSRVDILRFMLRETADQIGREEVDTPQVMDHRSFEQAVREWVRPRRQLVYLIDGFESLGRNPNVDGDFFSFLRSLTSRYSVAFITASQDSLLTLVDQDGQLSSPFFNIFMPLHLGFLDSYDARCMIHEPSHAAGVEFSEDVQDLILDLAGPHPFFLQVTCFHAFDLSREDPSFGEQACRRLDELVQTDLGYHFDYFVSRLSEEERRALACLLDAGESDTSTAALETLEHKCLVQRRGGHYSFTSRAFAEYYGRQIGKAWSAAVAEGDRRMATVLFVDVVDFTPMTEQHLPEEILGIIKPALQTFVDAVDHHGGKVANFGGDSVIAVFGVPTARPDDAIRAVRAALEIQTNVAAYAHELKERKGIDFSARIGLDTGVVVLGEIGGEQRAEFTALGDPVNLAARLGSREVAQPGTIVMSKHTYQQVRGRFKVKSMGHVAIKGKSRLVRAYQVLEVRLDKH